MKGLGLTTRKCLVAFHGHGCPAVSLQLGIPELRNGPASRPHDRSRNAEYNIDRDDDKPNDPPHGPGRDAQEGDSERGFAPCRRENGGEAGRVRDHGRHRHLFELHIFIMEADPPLGAFGEHGGRDQDRDLGQTSRS